MEYAENQSNHIKSLQETEMTFKQGFAMGLNKDGSSVNDTKVNGTNFKLKERKDIDAFSASCGSGYVNSISYGHGYYRELIIGVNMVDCVWFDADGKKITSSFDEATLEEAEGSSFKAIF